nr:DUF5698 domain-containing protein [Tissierella sp.]
MGAYLFIFFARVIDVSLATVRTLMVVQGRKIQAAMIGFFEVTVYVIALGKVMGSLDNPWKILTYGLGFACGNIVGIAIENKIALGNLDAQIILQTTENQDLIRLLRDNKFGVTVLHGEGIQGPKDILKVALNRKDLDKLKKIIYSYDENIFITVSNTSPISGGYFNTMKRNIKKK